MHLHDFYEHLFTSLKFALNALNRVEQIDRYLELNNILSIVGHVVCIDVYVCSRRKMFAFKVKTEYSQFIARTLCRYNVIQDSNNNNRYSSR